MVKVAWLRRGFKTLCERLNCASPVYLATAEARDEEMAERISQHQMDRMPAAEARWQWKTVEKPLNLAATLSAYNQERQVILVDCLTLWLSNCLLDSEARWEQEREALLQLLPQMKAKVVFVSNEVGQGVVPADALSRRFVDESGRLHQQLAKQCSRVSFVIAGIEQLLKIQKGNRYE